MSNFDIFKDSPGLLRTESLTVNIKMDRTSSTTARITWNIPIPAAGCAAGDQTYCGMVITLDTKPVSASSMPSDGQVYTSDPAASTNIHAGDKLGTALVVGAFYNDRTSASLDITGLQPNTAYYVSGFPTDCQFRYFKEGVHAYSVDYKSNGTDNTQSTQVVALNISTDPTGVTLNMPTGLASPGTYTFDVSLGIVPKPNRPVDAQECLPTPPKYSISITTPTSTAGYQQVNLGGLAFPATSTGLINGPTIYTTVVTVDGIAIPISIAGNAAQTYLDLVNELNTALGSAAISAIVGGNIVITSTTVGVGSSVVISSDTLFSTLTQFISMSTPIAGTDMTYGELIDEINHQFALLENPVQSALPPQANTYVVTGTPKQVYLWDGYTHIPQTFIGQPTAPNAVNINDYWYNTSTSVLNQWNGTVWVVVPVLSYNTDPANPACDVDVWLNGVNAYTWNGTTWCAQVVYNQPTNPSIVTIPCGSHWFNTSTNYLYRWNDNTAGWVSVDAIQSTVDPTTLPANSYWYNETTRQLLTRTISNTWTSAVNVQYVEVAPSTPAPGAHWYNPTTNLLQIRDALNTAWVETEVIAYPTDPTVIDTCELWWKDVGLTTELYVRNIISNTWELVTSFFEQPVDPSLPPAIAQGTVWINTTTSDVYVWDNNCFKIITPLRSSTDPTTPAINTVWLNPLTGTFNIRTLTGWVIQPVIKSLSDPTAPIIGTLWLNTTTLTLSSWNGISWTTISAVGNLINPATGSLWYNTTSNALFVWNGVTYVRSTPLATLELNCNNHFIFTHTLSGSLSFIKITDGTLFEALGLPFHILSTTPGSDGVSSELSYNEQGIGTDGGVDERRKLANDIRYALGYPAVDVELTPEQMDIAMTMAISEFRSRSSAAYKRSFFFMRTNSEEQRYVLTNKIQGMNKIVSVLSVTRLTSSFLSAAHGSGVYGQVILQQLYNMGNFDILSYHLQAEYVKTLEIMFAGRITFTFDEHTRELFMHTRLPFSERVVLIEAMTERTEQDLINDRWSKEWIRRFSTAKCKEMLSQIRGKWSTLPGAGGNVSLNAVDLATQAAEEIRMCYEEISDFIADRPENIGMAGDFIFG